jgi:serine/threonine protein kinase
VHSGSFAVVRKGISKADGTVYAVKYIDKRKLGQDDAAMLESECAVLKEVNHPNIVILHEIFDSPEELVLVMEFANGGEMLEKLKKMSQYSEGEASETGNFTPSRSCQRAYSETQNLSVVLPLWQSTESATRWFIFTKRGLPIEI